MNVDIFKVRVVGQTTNHCLAAISRTFWNFIFLPYAAMMALVIAQNGLDVLEQQHHLLM